MEQSKFPLIESLLNELDRAVRMITLVDDVNYRRQSNSSGSVGAQFRHNLDFIDAFLKGVEVGRIDYGDRQRDARTENDSATAIARIRVLKGTIEKLLPSALRNSVSVRSEIATDLWLESSVLRELEFVYSHTVHHHAIISEKLLGFGIRIEKDFGVAASTLQYWEKQAA